MKSLQRKWDQRIVDVLPLTWLKLGIKSPKQLEIALGSNKLVLVTIQCELLFSTYELIHIRDYAYYGHDLNEILL